MDEERAENTKNTTGVQQGRFQSIESHAFFFPGTEQEDILGNGNVQYEEPGERFSSVFKYFYPSQMSISLRITRKKETKRQEKEEE